MIFLTAASVPAAVPGSLESRWEPDPLQPGAQWWRDTTNQNAIAQYFYDMYPQLSQDHPNPLTEVAPGVYVVRGIGLSNAVALIGPDEWVLIDSLDSPQHMQLALLLLRPYIGTKRLKALIYTGVDPTHISGSSIVAPLFSIPVYASANWGSVLQAESTNSSFTFPCRLMINGTLLNEDPDGRIGPTNTIGKFLFQYPSNQISAETTVTLAGFNITLIPVSSASDADMLVWLPDQKVLISGDSWSPAFPNIGPLIGHGRPVPSWIDTLDRMKALNPDLMLPTHGPVVSSSGEIHSILTNHRDAMQYVYDATQSLMGLGVPENDAAAQVQLPESLAGDPYLQPFVASISSAVKGIYHQNDWWFMEVDGAPVELTSTLTTMRRAEIMAQLNGSIEDLLGTAMEAELAANDITSAEGALLMAWVNYQSAPGNILANRIYIQALTKNAYMQRSNQIRNYYLTKAAQHQQTMPADTTPPVVTPPPDKKADATGPLTSVDIGTATATDDVGVISISSDAPSGFPVGVTTVTWTATDAAGNEGTATQRVTVVIIGAKVNYDPNTLNLKSKGGQNSFTAYIELPSGYDVGLINMASVKLSVNGMTVAAQLTPTSVGDYDGDKIPDRMMKFDRQAVITALAGQTGSIVMTVNGQLTDGRLFTGSGTIKVTNPGK